MKTPKIANSRYRTRDERHSWLARYFSSHMKNSVCGIGGGGERALQRYLPAGTKYYEVDIAGEPDLKCNLEKDLPLPIRDREYDTVVCTEVLEHVDNLHHVLDEVYRIADKNVIISLPNCPIVVLRYIFGKRLGKDRNRYGRFSKYYGLPFEADVDRHKWFFSCSDIVDFFECNSKLRNFEISDVFVTPSFMGLGYFLFSIAYRLPVIGDRILDFGGGSVWIRLSRNADND